MPEMKTWTANGVQFTLPFAPDGYGLGGYSKNLYASDDINNITSNGWYSWQSSAPANTPAPWSSMLVMAQDDHYFQLVYIFGTDSVKYRYGIGGTWYQWNDMTPRNFAPAGYGLGGGAYCRTISTLAKLDNRIQNGWYRLHTNEPIVFDNFAFDYAYVRVDGYDENWVTQTIYPMVNAKHTVIYRHRFGGTGSWILEWENPPMELGVEYRTTERWDGKPVYAQRVNLGTLPNATSGAVPLPIIGAETFIDYNLVGTSTSNPQYQNLNAIDIELVFGFNDPGNANGSTWVDIHAKTNHSAYTGKLSVKYTKV